jgi:hypothetical protein
MYIFIIPLRKILVWNPKTYIWNSAPGLWTKGMYLTSNEYLPQVKQWVEAHILQLSLIFLQDPFKGMLTNTAQHNKIKK